MLNSPPSKEVASGNTHLRCVSESFSFTSPKQWHLQYFMCSLFLIGMMQLLICLHALVLAIVWLLSYWELEIVTIAISW